MKNEISWPTGRFNIVSKLAAGPAGNYVLTFDSSQNRVRIVGNPGPDDHWTATPDPLGGALLTHVKSGLTLAMTQPGEKLIMVPPGTDMRQLWRVETLGDPWVGINALMNWEWKVNVFGSDPGGIVGVYHWDHGADNEKWLLG